MSSARTTQLASKNHWFRGVSISVLAMSASPVAMVRLEAGSLGGLCDRGSLCDHASGGLCAPDMVLDQMHDGGNSHFQDSLMPGLRDQVPRDVNCQPDGCDCVSDACVLVHAVSLLVRLDHEETLP